MTRRTVVPVIDAIAIKVALANLRPIFGWIAPGVGLIPKPLRAHIFECRASALLPRRVNAAQRAINRVTNLVHRDALIVVANRRRNRPPQQHSTQANKPPTMIE